MTIILRDDSLLRDFCSLNYSKILSISEYFFRIMHFDLSGHNTPSSYAFVNTSVRNSPAGGGSGGVYRRQSRRRNSNTTFRGASQPFVDEKVYEEAMDAITRK